MIVKPTVLKIQVPSLQYNVPCSHFGESDGRMYIFSQVGSESDKQGDQTIFLPHLGIVALGIISQTPDLHFLMDPSGWGKIALAV